MSSIYRIVVFGSLDDFDCRIEAAISQLADEFELKVGKEIELLRADEQSSPTPIATVGIYVGSTTRTAFRVPSSMPLRSPIIPIVSVLSRADSELPVELSSLNAMEYCGDDRPVAIACAAMECLGLLPQKRRVFLSYRRIESREAALQLFDELSERQFDVFLDTHDVRPGEIFQDVLWHRLCESDVMVMLDTAAYFYSRWTREEFGKACYKRASILRVGWPGVNLAPELSVTENIVLDKTDLDDTGRLCPDAIARIGESIEYLRSKSIAVRHANLAGVINTALLQIGGSSQSAGPLRRIRMILPSGKSVLAYPIIGVPSAEVLNEIAVDAGNEPAALVYDHVGIKPRWNAHLDWLGRNISSVRWMPSASLGWDLIAWDSE